MYWLNSWIVLVPSQPLVSVAIPCYNSASTLPMALASLIAQTYQNWECIVVDDGSTDGSAHLVASLHDRRIRLVRLSRNYGRGVARQIALEAARGDFLCSLDADDWLYPNKLEHQLLLFQQIPEAGMVTTGIAIVDQSQSLVGVRAKGRRGSEYEVCGPSRGVALPKIAIGPMMIRMELAKGCRYDRRLRRSQDADFLLQLLPFASCVLSPQVTYVYSELRSRRRSQTMRSYGYHLLVVWKHRHRDPAGAIGQLLATVAKGAFYGMACAAGFDEWLVRRRSAAASAQEQQEFEEAKRAVLSVHRTLFREVAPSAPTPEPLQVVQGAT
ncbi:MAG TPA: glycosyltransferase family A protein [Caldilineaceae bacterium]|nr:glycosyltransferase family A protein [Caldilineaceae bacterium]